ncbi:DUF5682 family protein [Fodinicola acaciae]|uniref:DUF5682 family protein n=1 Tax=Fodinicola acaciae TaxID=2681555 RepID=UPI0013D5CF92|nr:DUF5682 family protein [Fodinicola acaciae]
MSVVSILPIRHHGPGSARAVVTELDRLRPQIVLIEGPPEADALVELAGDPDMVPPVALLAYLPDRPRVASFWPFSTFSPEWQAIQWALRAGVPVRFCDLPASANLAHKDDDQDGEATADPLGMLAAAAGYDDPERWWDAVIETRADSGVSPFPAVIEAMTELRQAAPEVSAGEKAWEDKREAHMRTTIRKAVKEGKDPIAVVCGAWHSPALLPPFPSATADRQLLTGLAKKKAQLTWVPWTHTRIAAASGYGAGIISPGWYHHLFTSTDRPVVRWLTAVAATLREQDLPVSSAHVIEAARLAETLAALRGRSLAGLAELTEATRSVLCEGDDMLVDLVTRKLVIGEQLGRVPPAAPTVPLEADLRAQARRLRLQISANEKTITLDLRKPNDRDKSRLLHRLLAIGIDWAEMADSQVRHTGTFAESWTLAWRPELSVAVIDAARWGTTVAAAAANRLVEDAETADTLAGVTDTVERTLLSDLPEALAAVLAALDAKAAVDLDIAHLMAALPALARSLRYGDVRGTDTGALGAVTDAILVRVCAGLPAGIGSLDDAGAAQMSRSVEEVHAAVALRDDESVRDRWLDTLAGLIDRRDVHGLLVGRLVRLLLDSGRLEAEEAAKRLSAALSVGAGANAKAAWIQGFLAGGGLLLLNDPELLRILDDWVSTLDSEDFVSVLPLLRRTFGALPGGERRNLADKLKQTATGVRIGAADDIDADRAAGAVATVALLIGVPPDG